MLTRLLALLLILAATPLHAEDVSPPPILQWFDASYATMQKRIPDLFLAGYGAVWVPPTGRADSGNQSVGYDVYDRFDLGKPGNPTLYGTEDDLKEVARVLHRAGGDLHIDIVWNHNGFSTSATNDGANNFVQAGDYPGFVVTLPNSIDGDFHSAFAPQDNDLTKRLSGLIDIDHSTNHRFVRNPVPGEPNNIPAGTIKLFGRIADVPDDANRRFYPDPALNPISVFDPVTGQQNIKIFPFNLTNPQKGAPVEENATGYLMRNAQWLVQTVGADGFRIDAAKHFDRFVLDFYDRAVYRANHRKLLDGSTKHVFAYLEVDGDTKFVASFRKKTINKNDPGRIGANRDVLDFPFYHALANNLTGNGLANDWRGVNNSGLDVDDDGVHNGSAGVKFVSNHDKPYPHPFLDNVGYACVLMMPGNAVVYHNAHEFGANRDFPIDGRGDALGGVFGQAVTTLVQIRNSHGRGDYHERFIEKELFAFEREGSALVLLSNRLDSGFDSRNVQTSFPAGTLLVELTGNASDTKIDPNDDLPPVLKVKNDGTVDVRFARNTAPNGTHHNSGYLIYGLSGPQAEAGIELTNVDHVDAGATPDAATNGTARLAELPVIKAGTFQVKVRLKEVKLLGDPQFRDEAADGDAALLRIDGGIDVNGNGKVDHVTPGAVEYGFEEFTDKHDPRIGPQGLGGPRGSGEFVQTIDASKLGKGIHFIEVLAFRHRPSGGPVVYTSLRKAIRVDQP